MDWTAIGIGISILIAIIGVLWREILFLRKKVHDMDSTTQRLVVQTDLVDKRINEIKITLDRHGERYEEMLERIHENLTDLKLTRQLLNTMIKTGAQ